MLCVPPRLRYIMAVLAWLLAGAPAPAAAGPHLTRAAETCRFFSNAAFKDRARFGETTFRMELAQDCVDALVYLQSSDPDTALRARRYLAQLAAYRAVMVGMIVDRARRRPALEDARLRPAWRPAVQPISRAGAYLIARDMGLVDTHRSWTSWRRAASLPLFRLDEIQAN